MTYLLLIKVVNTNLATVVILRLAFVNNRVTNETISTGGLNVDNKRIIKTPIAALCYGIISSDNQRLFAIQDAESGHYVLPIFTDFEAAEIYRKHQNKTMMDETLPIKAMGGDSEDVLPEQLSLCVMDKPKKLQDMLDLVHIAVRMAFITINPTYGAGMMCYQMDELEIVE